MSARGQRLKAIAVKTWHARQAKPQPRRKAQAARQGSWWLDAPRDAWSARCAAEAQRMEASREAQWLTAYRVEVAGKAEQG